MGSFSCPVCGYPSLRKPPQSIEGAGSQEICPSCGFQFGWTDNDQKVSYEKWRLEWIAQGMPWNYRRNGPPIGWDPRSQLQDVIEAKVPTFTMPREFTKRDAVSMWIGFSPHVRSQPDLFIDLLRNLMALVEPFGARYIKTDETCFYRHTLSGYNALAKSISRNNINEITLTATNTIEKSSIKGACRIRLGELRPVSYAASMDLMLFPNEASAVPSIIEAYITFIARWFRSVSGASAAISVRGCGTAAEGFLPLTQREREHGILREWQAVRRYVRGTFWGTALGAEQCARLGGQEQVLREAPCAIKRPLGTGVWLQLSEMPPAEFSTLIPFQQYLLPLQTWKEHDINTNVKEKIGSEKKYKSNTNNSRTNIVNPSTDHLISPPQNFSLKYIVNSLTTFDMTINIHLLNNHGGKLTVLNEIVQSWYLAGKQGAYTDINPSAPFITPKSPYVFSTLRGPTVGDSVVRWYVLYKNADRERALRALFTRLATTSHPRIAEIVIGTETIE